MNFPHIHPIYSSCSICGVVPKSSSSNSLSASGLDLYLFMDLTSSVWLICYVVHNLGCYLKWTTVPVCVISGSIFSTPLTVSSLYGFVSPLVSSILPNCFFLLYLLLYHVGGNYFPSFYLLISHFGL